MKKHVLSCALLACMLGSCCSDSVQSFDTDYFRIDINSKGYIVGMWNRTKESRNFSPEDQPSPLLALYITRKKLITEMGNIVWNMKTVLWLR